MLRTELLEPVSPRWASFLGATPHDAYHLPGYTEVNAEYEGGVAIALHVRDGERALLVPLIVRPIPDGGRDATSAYGYPGPIVRGAADEAFVREALAAGVAALAEEGIVSLFIRLHPLLNETPPEGIGTVVHHGDTVGVDLGLSEDETWRGMRENHRRDITRSMRLGHVFRFDPTDAGYRAFQVLYRDTMTRLGAVPYLFFDEGYFRSLRERLGEALLLGTVEIEGTLAAAALFTRSCGIVQLHLSGSHPDFARFGPAKLLYHRVGQWARDQGDTWLHLGGGLGASHDSLFHFKLGFSSRAFPFRTLRVVVRPDEYAAASIAHGADPTNVSEYFPAYRSPATRTTIGGEPASLPHGTYR